MISEVESSTVIGETRGPTRVLHVIPSTVARGAQVYARGLVDLLNDVPGQSHTLLSLFGGSSGISADAILGPDASPNRAVGFDPIAAFRLHRFVTEHSPDVLVAHGGDPLKFAVAAFNRVPIVYHAIGTVGAALHGASRGRLWKALVGRARLVAAVSDDVAQECRDLLGVADSKLVVVPNGRDTTRYRRREPEGDLQKRVPVLLFVGRLTEGKRPDLFLDVVVEVRSRGYEVEAWLVGDGALRDRLVDPAAAAGVEVLGERDDVPELMGNADIFVFPSLPEGEGMPGVLIEAGLSGLAAVASDVPGVRQVVEDGVTGSVVPPGDPGALTDRVCDLLADRARREAMGEAARSRCESEFGMESSAMRWMELLDSVGRS